MLHRMVHAITLRRNKFPMAEEKARLKFTGGLLTTRSFNRCFVLGLPGCLFRSAVPTLLGGHRAWQRASFARTRCTYLWQSCGKDKDVPLTRKDEMASRQDGHRRGFPNLGILPWRFLEWMCDTDDSWLTYRLLPIARRRPPPCAPRLVWRCAHVCSSSLALFHPP